MADGDVAFFLDTSTQISRKWEDEKISSYLNKELSQKTCYSSVYVKHEYKLRILNDAILVYNTTVDSGTLDEAKSRLDNLMKRLGRRPDELPYKVFSRLLKEYSSKKPFLRKLEKIIELSWSNYFYGHIKKTLFKLVECKSSQDDPYKNETGDYYVGITSRCSSDCKIDVFLKSQHCGLKILANIPNSKLDKLNDPKGILNKIKSVSTAILGGKSPRGKPCKELSDAVISMEAKASDPTIILHSMDSDIKLICDVLNIPVLLRLKHKILKDRIN
jgi:hypothetical protein